MSSLASALQSLPHGPEFRFVDELESLDPGREAVGTYCLPVEAAFLRGHFPGRPLLPGVLMVEALAQVAGIAAQTDPNHEALADLRLAAIRQVKIHGTIEPGQTLRIAAKVNGRFGGLIQAEGRVTTLDDRLLAEGQVTLAGAPVEAPNSQNDPP